jgi:mono/diheme cytochrome c family protein
MKHILTFFTALQLAPLAVSEAAVPDFQKEILPVLERRCFDCHGSDKQKSGLRVDSRAALLKGGDFGAAIVPGDAAGSHLIEVIVSSDDDVKMPPKGERLTIAEIESLKKWIAQGALWPGQMDAVAEAKITSSHWSFQPLAKTFAHDSLDDFLGTAKTPEADRRTLIRRVTLDLTGLPPTPEEVEAFVKDKDERAYEKVVERLLASKHYGERWAQHWLDVIRYADTRGYEYNSLRENTWPFRDWVIDALNHDLPYDQFLFQQIAGDTVGVDPATGFLVTAPLPTPPEIGQEPNAIKAARFNALDEIIQNVGASMLGLTVGCARCHNHKFDPIPSRDYYRMLSVFSGVKYESRPWRDGSDSARMQELKKVEQRMVQVRAELAKFPSSREVNDGQYTDHFNPTKAKWVRLSISATDATKEGPAFDEIEVWAAAQAGDAPQLVSSASQGGRAFSSGAAKQLGSRNEFLNDGKYGAGSTWVASTRPPAWVQIELKEPTVIDRFVWSRDRILAKTNITTHGKRLTSEWRIEVAEKEGEWRSVDSRSEGLDATAIKTRSNLEQELAKLTGSQTKLRIGPEVFAGKFTQPELIHVLMRGDPEQPRDPVGPGALSVLAGFQLPTDAPDAQRRAAFAKWLTHEAAPLTARVAVNRLWHHHFGSGLVSTPSDFGLVGARPTHPELLDWLATQLITDGWSLKKMHQRIVMSAAYRQSSFSFSRKDAAQAAATVTRAPRRLDAESIRDSMLVISGQLDHTMGGEGVNLFTRKGSFDQWKPLTVMPTGASRRMIYHARIRGADDGMFKTFDIPECGQVKDKRSDSTTPLQALNLLNGQFTLEQSAALAQRITAEAGADLLKQITRAFQLTIARPPGEHELTACLAVAQSDGLETVCRALFNSNEFLFLP